MIKALAGAAALIFIAGIAHATGPDNNATSGSAAGAISGSASGAAVNSQINQYGGSTPDKVTLRTTPDISAPTIVGGGCTVGRSLGATFIGVGATGGFQDIDGKCQDIALATFLMGLGNGAKYEQGKEILCKHEDLRQAFARSGDLCHGDRRVQTSSAVMPVVSTALSTAPVYAPPREPYRPAFDPALYTDAASCLTAAYSAGSPLNVCAGKN